MLHYVPCYIFLVTSTICVNGFLVPDGKVSVKTNVGEIVGYSTVLNINGSQKVLNKFLGIPYAKPPIGTRRFRKPEPIDPFSSPLDASTFGPACLQLKLPGTGNVIKNVTHSEDCLYLNVFTPSRLATDHHLYPTMIWIHGGGFVIGSSNDYDSGPLSLSGDVVVVTINYRLNLFGFLSTYDNDTRGNMGLFDQHLAIRWIHDNIQAFGGDPNRITIFGESAGSASVAYQIIYPGNKGLVHRAIAESGSFSSPWAFKPREDVRSEVRVFATAVGCFQTDDVFLVKCLQTKPASELLNAYKKIVFKATNATQGILGAPVVDNDFVLDDPKNIFTGLFPSKDVEETFRDIDLIIGVNNKEGHIQYPPFNESARFDFNKSYIDTKLIPDTLRVYRSMNDSVPTSIRNLVTLEYTDWENLDDNKKQFNRLVDLISDLSFHVPAAQTAYSHALSATKHTYVYELSAAPQSHILSVYKEVDGPNVANHGDDLAFIFGPWFVDNADFGANITVTAEQRGIGQAMVIMWSNFAKTGYVCKGQ